MRTPLLPSAPPARYGLLSGRSPWLLGKKGNDYHLEKDRLNIAFLLKAQGYRSAAIGKWHLGYGKDWNKTPITGPPCTQTSAGTTTEYTDQNRHLAQVPPSAPCLLP